MKISWPHAFKVGGFLAGLCAILALAIAGGDLITRDIIAKNKLEKENSGLKKVFPNGQIGEAVEVRDGYLQKYWTVKSGEEELGRVYSTFGKNAYGDVSLLVGVYSDFTLGNIVTLENTESYGATLEEGYLEPYAAATNKEEAVEKVNCGATYGAKLCRDMILAAKQHYEGGQA